MTKPKPVCPKCKATSSNDWQQCGGKCPVPVSPHFDADTARKFDPEGKLIMKPAGLL